MLLALHGTIGSLPVRCFSDGVLARSLAIWPHLRPHASIGMDAMLLWRHVTTAAIRQVVENGWP